MNGHDMTGNLLGFFLKGDLNLIGLFQTLFDSVVWHAIDTQRCPVSTPDKLGHILRLDKI
jgi:hypothetical protein